MLDGFNLLDHLEYVRLRIVRAALYFLGSAILGYAAMPRVLDLMTDGVITGLVFLSPAEAFFSRLKLALAIGLLISFPFIVYQAWGLVEPAVAPKYKRSIWFLLPTAYALFLGGVLFSFTTVLPIALEFLLGFGSGLSQEISIAHYISFVLGFVLPFGLVFQLPIAVVFMTRIGVLRPRALAAQRKYVILGVFVIGALLTPPDIISQFMLAVPLLALFELSLLLARWVEPEESPRTNGKDTSGEM